MKVLIIEDEKPAIENLVEELLQIDESFQVVGTCDSVQESIQWLTQNTQPDIIFMDIQLSDGLSFNIFKSCSVTCPIVFITAYDKYLTQAFDYNSIDYLLKPINTDKLKCAIRKYKNLQNYFVNNHSALLDYLNTHDKKKSRILVKRGIEFQAVKIEEIVYFFTEHKLVFLVDKENRKYLAEKSNLSELEEELDKNLFYRANRKYIINANYVKRFKPLDRSKLSVELHLPLGEEIIISQENSSSFKKWISEM
jgi:two-component system LytT family response regulator